MPCLSKSKSHLDSVRWFSQIIRLIQPYVHSIILAFKAPDVEFLTLLSRLRNDAVEYLLSTHTCTLQGGYFSLRFKSKHMQ